MANKTGDMQFTFSDVLNPGGGHGYGTFVLTGRASVSGGSGSADPITDAEIEDLAERIKGSDFMARSFASLDVAEDMDTTISVTEDRQILPPPI
jgi:hypothetical protein